MHLHRNRRRNPRAHEWTRDKSVTFIVTLAATRCVTLAARRAGMSRKSAYALKSREPLFAAAWAEALAAQPRRRRAESEGDKADKADTPPSPRPEGDSRPRDRRQHEQARDLYFARLAAAPAESRRFPGQGLLHAREPLSLRSSNGRRG